MYYATPVTHCCKVIGWAYVSAAFYHEAVDTFKAAGYPAADVVQVAGSVNFMIENDRMCGLFSEVVTPTGVVRYGP